MKINTSDFQKVEDIFLNKTLKIKDRYGDYNLITSLSKPRNEIFQQFRQIIRCFEEIHSGQWGISFNCNSDQTEFKLVNIAVRFEEFDIVNEEEDSHEMKDLFILIGMQYDVDHNYFMSASGIKGTRTQLNYLEYTCGYWHSHLSQNHIDHHTSSLPISSFCLGSGAVNGILQDMRSEESYNEDHWIGLLIQINTIATHESLEGTPYISINNIQDEYGGSSSSRSYSYSDLLDRSQRGVNSFLEKFKQLSSDQIKELTYLSGDTIRLETEKFKTYLVEFCDTENLRSEFLFTHEEGSSYYYSFNVSSGYKRPPQNLTFPFKDSTLTLEIYDHPDNSSEDYQRTNFTSTHIFNPVLKDRIKNNLEYLLNTI